MEGKGEGEGTSFLLELKAYYCVFKSFGLSMVVVPVFCTLLIIDRYLQFRGFDTAKSKTYLSQFTHVEFITFLQWLCDRGNASRISTLKTIWAYIRMYIQHEGGGLPPEVRARVDHFIRQLGP